MSRLHDGTAVDMERLDSTFVVVAMSLYLIVNSVAPRTLSMHLPLKPIPRYLLAVLSAHIYLQHRVLKLACPICASIIALLQDVRDADGETL